MYVSHPGVLLAVLTTGGSSVPLGASRRGGRPVCPAERSSALGATAHQRRIALDGKQIGIMTTCQSGADLSRSKLPPGWRPAAQTRASPPHQAKSGLDGDPGVWAYVCFAIARVFQTGAALKLWR